MTLAQLRTELYARGFDYLDATRSNSLLNFAYQIDICEAEDWPFLEATTTGTAPLSITDIRTIESVVNTTSTEKLVPMDRRNITDDWDTNLATVGTATAYYTTSGTSVSVYPADTASSLSVRYWKVPTTLSADSDTPILPTRWHPLIVDAAVVRAYEDADEGGMAQNARGAFDQRLQLMRESLLSQNHDQPDDFILQSGDW